MVRKKEKGETEQRTGNRFKEKMWDGTNLTSERAEGKERRMIKEERKEVMGRELNSSLNLNTGLHQD